MLRSHMPGIAKKSPAPNGSRTFFGRVNMISGDICRDRDAAAEASVGAAEPDGDDTAAGAGEDDDRPVSSAAEAAEHHIRPRPICCYTSTSLCNRPPGCHCNICIHRRTEPVPRRPEQARVPRRPEQAPVPGSPRPRVWVPPHSGPDSRYRSPDGHRWNLHDDDAGAAAGAEPRLPGRRTEILLRFLPTQFVFSCFPPFQVDLLCLLLAIAFHPI